jgi:hypothetical protein
MAKLIDPYSYQIFSLVDDVSFYMMIEDGKVVFPAYNKAQLKSFVFETKTFYTHLRYEMGNEIYFPPDKYYESKQIRSNILSNLEDNTIAYINDRAIDIFWENICFKGILVIDNNNMLTSQFYIYYVDNPIFIETITKLILIYN